MASVLDVLRTTTAPAAPAGDADVVGPPAPPPKRTVADVVAAHQAAQNAPSPDQPKPGATAGASLGDLFRRDKERAETPALLRRPEEPVAYTPSPDEPPELLKRPYEEPPPGAYGVPTTGERVLMTGARIGAPIVASTAAGWLTGPGAPVTAPLAGAAASTATELALQKYEKARGFRKEVSPGGVAFQGALGTIQGLPLPATLSAPARFAARTAEGTAFGTGATTAGTLIEEKRLPTKEELAWGAGMGAAFGAGGGAFEAKGVPYLHERSPEFIGPRPEGELSWRQRRAAQKFATSADQLAGETTAPPVGEQPRMVTRPGETIGEAPAPDEFVGPPVPERAAPGTVADRHPVGSDVEFTPAGAIGKTDRGTVVGHRVDPTTGETFAEVEMPGGRRDFAGDTNGIRPAAEAPPPGSLAAVQAERAAAAEPPGRVSPILRYDDVMGMSADDLEAAHAEQRAYEQSAAVDVFGPEEAKRYERLQRTANSTIAPHETTRAASDEIARMEAGLTPQQEARLFGFGEEGYNADELRRISQAARDYDPANVADRPDDDLLNTAGRELLTGNLKDDPVAAIRLHGALRELGNRGYDKSVIQDAVVRRAAREGISPGDAQELMDTNLRDLQAKRAAATPTPEPAQLAQGRALPAPEQPGEFVGPPAPEPFVGPPAPEPPPPGGEAPPPAGPPGGPPGEPPPGGPFAGGPGEGEPETPWGRRPTFRRYPGAGEAITGDEIAAQRHADPERVTRAIDSIDREFGDVLDDESRARLKRQIVDNQARFEYLGRGKQTMERTRGLGRDYLVDIDAAKLEPKGTTWNAEQTQAMKNHIAGLDLAIQDAQQAYSADPTPEHGLVLQKAVQDQIDAFNIFRARGAEAGRTVNIYKGTAEELASGNQRLMTAALRRGVPPDKLAEIIKSTKPEDVLERAEMLMAYSDRGGLYKRGRNLLKTIFISDILSGPGPHQRNIGGNAVRAYALTPAAELFGAAHERLTGVAEGERLVRAGEAGAHFVGMHDAFYDAVNKAAEILKRGYTGEQAATYDLPLNEALIGAHPAIRGAVNAVPRALGGMDMFFRVSGQEASLYSQAFTRGHNEALIERAAGKLPPGMTFDQRAEQLYRYYQKNPTPDMMQQAADEATRGVYQERDKVARMMTFVREHIPFGDFIIPFVTTSTNLAKQGLHWTPAGYLMPSTRGKVEGISPRTVVLHKGEALGGTVGMLLAPLALYAMGGKLHGNGPSDWNERQEWLKTHTPNSIELGGVNVGYNWMGPLAVPLAAIGNAWDKYDDIKRKQGSIGLHEMEDIAQEAILGTGESVLDQPYLQGLSNFINMVTHLRGKDADRYRSKFFKDIATGFIPASGLLRWAEQVGDPTIRESRTIGEKAMGGIPGLSERVPPKLDVFGEPQQVRTIGGPLGRAVFPFPVERSVSDPLREELSRHDMTLSPPSSITVGPHDQPLSPEEDLAIKQAKGRQLRSDLEDLLDSDAYLNADPETQKKMLKGYVGRTRARIGARAKAFRDTQGIDESALRY